MSFIDKLLGWRKKSNSTLDLFKEIFGREPSNSGKTVTVKTALEVSAVMACLRVLANGVAQVPLKIMLESPDGKQRLPAKDHPLYDVLAYSPNEWQTSFEFRETIALHVGLCGNFFAFKNVVAGKVKELIPFEPGNVVVVREDNTKLFYKITSPNGNTQTFPAETIWHIRGASWSTWLGLESVVLAREAIGLAIATEEQHARMHKNGVRNSGTYSVEGTLNETQYKGLRDWITQEAAGVENSGKAMILDRGAKWLNTSMTGVDSQHLETRKFQIEEVCRHLGVNPIMVFMESKNSTYASAEQMFLAHVVHTLSPWYQRLEQSIDKNLLSAQDRKKGYYSCFVEEGLLRGDSKSTAEFLTKLTTNGIMTRNEARAKLDYNPLNGLDEPLTPLNMQIGAEPQGDENVTN